MSQQTRLRQERVLVAGDATAQVDMMAAADAQPTIIAYRKQLKLR